MRGITVSAFSGMLGWLSQHITDSDLPRVRTKTEAESLPLRVNLHDASIDNVQFAQNLVWINAPRF